MTNGLISKQAAIDALREAENHAFNSFYKGLVKAHKIIANMPSAQPEIVYCKDCICGHGEVWLSGNGSADLYGYCGRTQLRVLPYDFCSYAERREE